MKPKRIMLQDIGKINSILLSEPVLNPVTLDMLHGSGDLIMLQDIEALQAVHTIDYVMGIALQKISRSFYRHGSNGHVNLFYRPEGLDYFVAVGTETYPASAEKSQWIIQWDGNPEYDSGYMQYTFTDEKSATVAFAEMEQEENA